MVENGSPSSVVVVVEADEYKWTDVDTETLIRWRSANECLFNGRRNAARKGFEEYVREHGLVGKVEPIKVKRKWENLKQKYKELKASRTGVVTEGGETTATSWKWFTLMDEALSRRHSIVSPVIVDSSIQDVFMVSPLSSRKIQTGSENQPKRRRNSEWVKILEMSESDDVRKKLCLEREDVKEKEAMEREEKRERERLEREEKRERERLEREEKRERERLVREEKREREWLEREERRERSWLDREEKREKERLDREERRELQWREWMDKRDNENAEREERRQREFMSFIENVFKKTMLK